MLPSTELRMVLHVEDLAPEHKLLMMLLAAEANADNSDASKVDVWLITQAASLTQQASYKAFAALKQKGWIAWYEFKPCQPSKDNHYLYWLTPQGETLRDELTSVQSSYNKHV